VFSHLANGVLLYAIFYGVAWLLMAKAGLLTQVAINREVAWPAAVEEGLLPFLVSAVSSFLSHAGLRLTLKRLRLRLSADEATASQVFLGVVTVLSFAGALARMFDGTGGTWLTPVGVVLGAWTGVAIRRRVPI